MSFFKKLRYAGAIQALKSLGYTDFEVDLDADLIAFEFAPSRVVTLNMDAGSTGYMLEATIAFAGTALTMPTISQVLDVLFAHRILTSGLSASGGGLVTVNTGYVVGKRLSRTKLGVAMAYLTSALYEVQVILTERVSKGNLERVDLSMFEGLGLECLNLKSLGEKSDFVYGGWDKFKDDMRLNPPPPIPDFLTNVMLSRIDACKSFEEKNQMRLSDVGDNIMEELLLYRKLGEVEIDTFDIH